MKTIDELNKYLVNSDGLAFDVSILLYDWELNKKASDYFCKTTTFFYEATVQNLITYRISEKIVQSQGKLADWLILNEQPYPKLPDQRADIWVVAPDGKSLVIEVKADFIKNSAQGSVQK